MNKFEKTKPGDHVLVRFHRDLEHLRIMKVKQVTLSQIILENRTRFRKSDGKSITLLDDSYIEDIVDSETLFNTEVESDG